MAGNRSGVVGVDGGVTTDDVDGPHLGWRKGCR